MNIQLGIYEIFGHCSTATDLEGRPSKNYRLYVPLYTKRSQFQFFVQFLTGFCRFRYEIASEKTCLDLSNGTITWLCHSIGRPATVSRIRGIRG